MATFQEEGEKLNEALRDLGYALFKPLLPLVERLPGYNLKPWVRERQIRERHR